MTDPRMQSEIAKRSWSVPSFEVSSFTDRSSKYVIVIPVINEGERIQRQLREMHSQGMMDIIDTLVIDGGSSDGSLCEDFLRTLGVRALLVKTGPGKLSAQLRCAYAWALMEGYEGIITIDGNGKDGISSLPQFAQALDEGFDYVQASRFLHGGYHKNTPFSRELAIRLIHAPILSMAAGIRLTDTTQGYRGYSSAYLLDERVSPFREDFKEYELLAYLTVRASQLGYRVKEIATSRVYPSDGVIPTKISGLWALTSLVWVLISTALGRYHPRSKRNR